MNNTMEINGETFLLLTNTEIKGEEYFYVARLEDGDINGEFFVYKKDSSTGSYIKITNSEELKEILLVLASKMV